MRSLVILIALTSACTRFGTAVPAPSDASVELVRDAASLPDASVGYCAAQASTPALCADFDTGPLETGWNIDQFSRTGGGTLTLESDDVRSPPNALSVVIPAADAGSDPARARLCRRFAPAGRLGVAFDVKVVAADETSPPVGIASLRFDYASTDTLYVELHAEKGRWHLHQSLSGTDVPRELTIAPPASTWSRVALEARVEASGSGIVLHATAKVDDVVAAESEQEWPVPNLDSETCIGITYAEATAKPFRLLFDNVAVDFAPAPR